MFLLTSIAWPYCELRYRQTEFECFLKLSADKLLLLKWWQAQVQFFKNVYQISRVHKRSHTFKILISNWLRTWKFNRLLHALKARRFWLFWLSRVDHAPRPIFYVVIGQILTGEFMRKIYAASGNLFTDSWSWQSFVSSCDVLTVFFYLVYKMKYSCYQDCSVIHGWFVYCAFCWQLHRLSKSLEIRRA